jgi:hypothetical protein
MKDVILVQIIGAPVACNDGVKDSWRRVATWVAGQLKVHFADQVSVKYFDLFDSDCPPIPENAQLPVVIIDKQLFSSGGKISVPLIRRYLNELMHDRESPVPTG